MFFFDHSTFRLSATCTLPLLHVCSHQLRSFISCFLCRKYHTRSMCTADTFVVSLIDLEVSRSITGSLFLRSWLLRRDIFVDCFCFLYPPTDSSSAYSLFICHSLYLPVSSWASLFSYLSSLHRLLCFSNQCSQENRANLAWSAWEDVHTQSILSGSVNIVWLIPKLLGKSPFR